MSAPDEAEALFDALVQIMAQEVVFEVRKHAITTCTDITPAHTVTTHMQVHRGVRTGAIGMNDLYADRRQTAAALSKQAATAASTAKSKGLDVYGRVPPREPAHSLTCPTCNRQVGVLR
jgi:hypothetical protein